MALVNEMTSSSSDIPLPNNWSVYIACDGRKVFVDHSNRSTSWTDPRDSLTKPQSFADCIGDELPVGWEQAYDTNIGEYFIDHNTGMNQLEDPREQWRTMQEVMIQNYLRSAKDSIEAKEKIVQLKEERSSLANQELSHLLHILQKINDKNAKAATGQHGSDLGSKNSLATTSSSCSLYSKYDPDLLRAEVEVAKRRVSRLKHEALCARRDLNQKQLGIETLARIEKGISERSHGYSNSEKNMMENQLMDLKKLSSSIEQEKSQLIHQISEIYNELQTSDNQNASLLEFPHEKASCSSQTDNFECTATIGNRMAALARARLRYNELKRLLCVWHARLAALNEKMLPAELELSGDQISLIREKEQLLRELKTVCGGNVATPAPPNDQRARLVEKMHELEDDLRQALRLTKEEMSERSKILQQKEQLETEIHVTGMSLVTLEQQLCSLSASTLSTSSLSTTAGSSSSSLTSPMLYGAGVDCSMLSLAAAGQSSTTATAVRMFDEVRRRVEQLIGQCDDEAIVAPPSEMMTAVVPVQREDSVGSTTSTDNGGNRSMSAAVSDESVAGDSGVGGGALNAGCVSTTPQIMCSLNFEPHANCLCVSVEKARNLSRLWTGDPSPLSTVQAVQIRGSLLPGDFNFRTDWIQAIVSDQLTSLDRPVFKRTFEVSLQLRAVCEKVLQLFVFVRRSNDNTECVGEAQLNLAEFNKSMMRSQWCNVLGWQFLRPPTSATAEPFGDVWSSQTGALRHLNTLKEESSDESTVIASQASTLSRKIESKNNRSSGLSCKSTYVASTSTKQDDTFCVRLTINDDASSQGNRTNVNIGEKMPQSCTNFVYLPTNKEFEIKTCEKETNTDFLPVPEETKFLAVDQQRPKNDKDCLTPFFDRKLNRSDSDTSVALQRKEPFKRNGTERRSLRWKKPSSSVHSFKKSTLATKQTSFEERYNLSSQSQEQKNLALNRFRTSIDIDLDLHTAKNRLARKKEDVENLRSLKSQLEQCRISGKMDLNENANLVAVLNMADKNNRFCSVICNENDESRYIRSKRNPADENRARHFIRKAARQVQKLNETKIQQPSSARFCKKISALVGSITGAVSVINVNAGDVS